jgi:Tol biopolymer transport system component/DNA-binding winged helix-turn-helix (wHTH) protein
MLLNGNNLFQFDEFTIDLNERTLWRDGQPIPLAPKVMETLCLLVENHGRLMTKEEMMNRLWADTFVEERNLTQNIFTLRKVLGDGEAGKKFVETVPRRGYRFVAGVRPAEVQEAIQVTRNTQTRISAEGYVPTQDLTEAVKEIAKTIVLERDFNSVEPKQIEAVQTRPSRRTVTFSVVGLAAVLAIGAGLWGWQNDYLTFGKTTFGSDAERGLLKFERLTDSGKAFFPVVSPNKQFFAYVVVDRGKHSIELQNIATGSKTVVVEPAKNEIGRPKFSADGDYLFYRQDQNLGGPAAAYRVPIFGGTPRLIAGSVNSDFSISPDGEWFAFIRFRPEIDGQQLVVCRSADGSEERAVATRTGNESFLVWSYFPAWSTDGKKVFVGLLAEPTPENPGARGEGFGLMDIADGTFERISTPEWSDFIQAEWMPGGESIVFLAREKANEPFQIWKVSYPSGEGRRVTNDAHDYRYLNVSPDGEFVLTTQEKTFFNLWSISTADPNEARQLTFSSELQHGDRGISWTPDGKHLVYTLVENGVDSSIWRIDVDTLEKRQLTFDQHRINWYPSVTPDGQFVIFTSNRERGTHIWEMDIRGGNLRQITDGIGEAFSNISADGKWLIYASPAWAPEALWKKSLTSEEPAVKLLTNAAGSNSISPDGNHIVVSYKAVGDHGKLEYRYGLMPLEWTEKPEDLGFNPYFGSMTWKQDSSGFYYIKDLGLNLNNIWFYDIRMKTHTQITDFNDRMSSLSLSPDGNHIATARGETISNIFKISGF